MTGKIAPNKSVETVVEDEEPATKKRDSVNEQIRTNR